MTDVLSPEASHGESLKPDVGGIATGEGVSQEECGDETVKGRRLVDTS